MFTSKKERNRSFKETIEKYDIGTNVAIAQVSIPIVHVKKAAFKGSDAVTYFVSSLELNSREEAVLWCRHLQKLDIIRHTSATFSKFKDGDSFFCWHTRFIVATQHNPVQLESLQSEKKLDRKVIDNLYSPQPNPLVGDLLLHWNYVTNNWTSMKKPKVQYLPDVPPLLLGKRFWTIKNSNLLPYGIVLHTYQNTGSYLLTFLDAPGRVLVSNKVQLNQLVIDFPFIYSIHGNLVQKYNIFTNELEILPIGEEILKPDVLLADKGYVVILAKEDKLILCSFFTRKASLFNFPSKPKVLPGLCAFYWPFLFLGSQRSYHVLDARCGMKIIYQVQFISENIISSKFIPNDLAVVSISPTQINFLKIQGNSFHNLVLLYLPFLW
eukprot:TRINITY_DN5620_c0_g1_i1.p1 TRINITY_DN5620_c0_g1~~TRINITY_DN5620_c0_g1_i1.p1  ORF type:complete len:381 (-),score=65.09 TRINITY_DN5620_c0_g1_i1:1186-2328(-)